MADWAQAAIYYSNNVGPNLIANWWTNPDGTGSHPLNFSIEGDIFISQSGQN